MLPAYKPNASPKWPDVPIRSAPTAQQLPLADVLKTVARHQPAVAATAAPAKGACVAENVAMVAC